MDEANETLKRSVEALNKALEFGQLDKVKTLLNSPETRLLLSRDLFPDTIVKVAHHSHWETLKFLLSDENVPLETAVIFRDGYFRPPYLKDVEEELEEENEHIHPQAHELNAFLAAHLPAPVIPIQAQSLLSAVAYRSNMDILKYLVEERGVDVKRRWNDSEAILWAAMGGNIAPVRYLAEKGASLEARDERDRNMLHIASTLPAESASSLLNFLFDRLGRDHRLLNMMDCKGRDPTLAAAMALRLDVLDDLVERWGSPLNLFSTAANPLTLAIRKAHLPLVRWYHAHNIDFKYEHPSSYRMPSSLGTCMPGGNFPQGAIWDAIRFGNAAVIDLILDEFHPKLLTAPRYAALPQTFVDDPACIQLFYAVALEQNNVEVIMSAINRRNWKRKDYFDKDFIAGICLRGNIDLLRLVLETTEITIDWSDIIDASNTVGTACSCGDLALVKYLVSMGAPITTIRLPGSLNDDPDDSEDDTADKTPLMFAAAFGSMELVEYLLAVGCSPFEETTDGLTALDFADEDSEVPAFLQGLLGRP